MRGPARMARQPETAAVLGAPIETCGPHVSGTVCPIGGPQIHPHLYGIFFEKLVKAARFFEGVAL